MTEELERYTIDDIRKLEPCYDPAEKIPEDWSGTVLDILKLENVKPEDKLWVVTRYLTGKQNRLFAVWCARESLKLIKEPDQRSIEACNVAEKFALGEATIGQLIAVRDAARDAAWDATGYAARAAARAAARDAAWAAAWDAAGYAAAAWDAAWDAARYAQIKRLIEAIENKEWD